MKRNVTATIAVAALVLVGLAVTAPAASARPGHRTAEAPSLLRVNGQAPALSSTRRTPPCRGCRMTQAAPRRRPPIR